METPIIENQTIMMTDEEKEKIILQRSIWNDQSRRFRERMGNAEFSNYIKPYMAKWNAKEETKAARIKKNAEYYLKKKAERLNLAIS